MKRLPPGTTAEDTRSGPGCSHAPRRPLALQGEPTMPRFLILAQSEVTANALGAWLELLGEKGLPIDASRIVWDWSAGREGVVDAYETLVRRVEGAARARDDRLPLNHVVALVDSVCPTDLNVIDEGGSWDNLIAMLILTFPEIRWVFGVARGKGQESLWRPTVEPHHNLTSLFKPTRRDPLFDPSGLRQSVRACTNIGLRKDDLELPTRQEIAAAIDEELPYAYLHGYTAYRFGFRADVVTTWAFMEAQFSCLKEEQINSSDNAPIGHEYWLLLEDMSLNFPDQPRTVHLLRLDTERAKACCWLDSADADSEPSEHRILVTTGQTRPGDTALCKNLRYLRNKAHGRGDVVFKPACGMFDLWAKAGLFRKWVGTRRRGDVPWFKWPPRRPSMSPESDTDGDKTGGSGHGTPGKLLLVAEALIRRAEALLGKVANMGEAVQGAVLATDALELTGGRTPTTAIQALSLKHRFEILAECQFSGVEYHVSITPRLDEIDLETRAICRWFASRQRDSAVLNSRMHILNQLVGILRQHNQFDEEQRCMNRVRHLHATLWMRERPWRYVFWLPIRYVAMLLSSFRGFVGMVVVWIIVLAVLFAWADQCTARWDVDRLVKGLESAVTSFFSVGPPLQHGKQPTSINEWKVVVSGLAMISGFLHLGVLISHLYMIVSRR
jgi:hypothetical protein